MRLMNPQIETFTGRFVDPLDLKPSDVCIEDVAHPLSMKPRFTGHAHRFVSIAQHCVNVSRLVEIKHGRAAALVGLFHEGDEVYGPDISSPMKQSPVFDQYKVCAHQAEMAVYQRFMPMHYVQIFRPAVKLADTIMLVAEARRSLPSFDTPGQWDWVKPFVDQNPWMMAEAMKLQIDARPAKAERQFLLRYRQLTGQPTTWWERIRAKI